jgi:hypothetical protein
MAKAQDDDNALDPPPTLLEIIEHVKETVVLNIKRCIGTCVKSSAPTPAEEVQNLLSRMEVSVAQFKMIYDTFYCLARSETDDPIIGTAYEVMCMTCENLVTKRRKWVKRILRGILTLGGCEDTIDWDTFVYVLMNFCSLNNCELCQCLFLVIGLEVGAPRKHYLTREELIQFYEPFTRCKIKSFKTARIDFRKLPLSRYYVSDFTELVTRFTQLQNPILLLQEELQAQLPCMDFWELYEPEDNHARKITPEFFLREKTHIHLRGNPPFRETCDMLLPDALGNPRPINQDQWTLRAPGLRQNSVWGEQQVPEVLEQLDAQDEAEARRREQEEYEMQRMIHGKSASAKKAYAEYLRKRDAEKLASIVIEHVEEEEKEPELLMKPGETRLRNEVPQLTWLPGVNKVEVKDLQPNRRTPAAWVNAPSSKAIIHPQGTDAGPEELCAFAASLTEEDSFPPTQLPPLWMRSTMCAPAPTQPYPNPPLRNRKSKENGFQQNAQLREDRMASTWGESGTQPSFLDLVEEAPDQEMMPLTKPD